MGKKLEVGEAGSEMQKEFERDNGLAEQYLAEANVKNLYDLYIKRCQQLTEFGATLCAMSELYAGKGRINEFVHSTPDAVASMERVAIAAIEMAKSFAAAKNK